MTQYVFKEKQYNVLYLLSGPPPDATVSLTVRIATLNSESKVSSTVISCFVFVCKGEVESEIKVLLIISVLFNSENMMADTEVPAAITPHLAGNSNKALAPFILRRRLLI